MRRRYSTRTEIRPSLSAAPPLWLDLLCGLAIFAGMILALALGD